MRGSRREFIESAHEQAFDRILHARVARVLQQTAPALSPEHVTRLRARILAMLVAGQVPHEYHEYHEYAKLLRRIGLGDAWAAARARVDEGNPYVMRYAVLHRFWKVCERLTIRGVRS